MKVLGVFRLIDAIVDGTIVLIQKYIDQKSQPLSRPVGAVSAFEAVLGNFLP